MNEATPNDPRPSPGADPQEQLRTSADRFALVLQATNEGLWDWDLATDVIYMSPRWKSMVGYADDEVEPTLRGFEGLIHPADRTAVFTAIESTLSGASPAGQVELRLRHKDGHYLHFVSRAAVARAPDGKPLHMVGILLDVTARKRLEGRIAAQYGVIRVLSAATTLEDTVPKLLAAFTEPTGWDLSCVRIVNLQTGRLEGFAMWRAPNVPGGEWEGRLLARPFARGEGLPGSVWTSGKPTGICNAAKCPGFPEEAGAAGMQSGCFAPIMLEGEVVAVFECFSRDIRQAAGDFFPLIEAMNHHVEETIKRRRSERELEKAERKYRQIVELSVQGVYQSTPGGHLLSANPALVRMLGYDAADELIGSPEPIAARLYVDADRRAAFLAAMKAKGAVVDFEARVRRKDGAVFWTSNTARAVEDDSGKISHFDGFVTDITDRKEADQMKADFVSFVSHQLRTPLSGIKWLLELAEAPDVPAEPASYIHDARASAERLIGLVNDLLDMARLESGRIGNQPEPVDLPAITVAVARELAPQLLEKSQTLVLPTSWDLPEVLMDPQLARQVVLNLISNANRYTPEGGRITVSGHASHGGVEWAVEDTGIGVPASARGRLFEKFFRADNASLAHTEGTGLGLYIVRLILERSGGRVWYDSREGVGTTFRFTVPAAVRG